MKKPDINGNKLFLFALPLFTLVVMTAYFSLTAFASTATLPSDSTIKTSIDYGSAPCVSYYNGATKEWTHYPCTHNLIVTSGLNALRDAVRGAVQFGNFTYIALGNSSNATSAAAPAAGDTVLSGEYASNGLTRAAGITGTLGTGNWSTSNLFTSSGVTLSTNKTCLFNQSSGGTMLACVNFPETQLQGASGDQLLVNWTSWFTSG